MKKIIVVSGPVIVDGAKILLDISGDDDFWKFCGGGIKENKSLAESASIRAKEELGIVIEIINQNPFLMCLKKPGDENVEVILVHFLSRCSKEIIPGESVRDWAWHDIDNLPNNLAPNVLPVLNHFKII